MDDRECEAPVAAVSDLRVRMLHVECSISDPVDVSQMLDAQRYMLSCNVPVRCAHMCVDVMLWNAVMSIVSVHVRGLSHAQCMIHTSVMSCSS